MKLTVPLPPNAANSRRHWRVALKQKKEYWLALDYMQLAGRIPHAPMTPLDPALIAVTLYLHNPMDHDNAMSRLKILLDWLKAASYIGDDSPSRLKWVGLPDQFVDRRNPRVELTLEAAA